MGRRKDQNVIVSGKAPILSVALGVCFSAAITYNALSRQDARHPAPFEGFWSLSTGSIEQDRPVLQPRSSRHRPATPQPPDPVVTALQVELASLGYYDGAVDGLDGPQTRAAIEAYQKDHKLVVSGKATSQLLDHVRLNRRIREAVTPGPEASAETGASERIRLVQTGLAELGYAPGPIDGVLGEQTQEAIRSFQKHRRMAVTGRISDGLIRELHTTTGLSSLKPENGNS